jgi:hypothetical protein
MTGAAGTLGGVADGVTIPVVEGTELPTRFWAEIVTEYVRPFVRPVTVNDVEGAVTVLVRAPPLKFKVTR